MNEVELDAIRLEKWLFDQSDKCDDITTVQKRAKVSRPELERIMRSSFAKHFVIHRLKTKTRDRRVIELVEGIQTNKRVK